MNPPSPNPSMLPFNSPSPLPAAREPGSFEDLLKTEEVAALLHIHRKTVQRMAKQHRLPSVRIGRRWLFRLSALDQLVAMYTNCSALEAR